MLLFFYAEGGEEPASTLEANLDDMGTQLVLVSIKELLIVVNTRLVNVIMI